MTSYARPGRLFTASSDLIVRQVARVKQDVLGQIIGAVVAILNAALTS